MTAPEAMTELRDYYGKKFNTAVQTRAEFLLKSISEENIADVIGHVIEHVPRKYEGLDVTHIREACDALGISYTATHYIPAEDWICDACGHAFRYAQCVSDEDKLDKSLFDVCPMCGFQPNWTKTYTQYKQTGSLSSTYAEWYKLQKQKCTLGYGAGGIADNGQEKKPYWSRALVEREMRAERKISIVNKLAKTAISKRYDLQGEL